MSRFFDRRKKVGVDTARTVDVRTQFPSSFVRRDSRLRQPVHVHGNCRAVVTAAATTLRNINVPAILALVHLRYGRHCPVLICLSEEVS